MSALTPVTDAVVTLITGSVLPAVLTVLGALLTFIVAVYGALHVYAMFTGGSSSDVFYKLGRIFGSEIYNAEYSKYASRRDRFKRNESFRKRYDRENL